MPTGTGAVNLRNLPVTRYQVNPDLFNQLTSRVIFNPIVMPLPSVGNYVQNQLLQVGIVGSIRLRVAGTIAYTGAAIAGVTDRYPWDLLSKVEISGNGQNNFISCSGSDLRLRMLAANRAMNDSNSLIIPTAAQLATAPPQSFPFELFYEIPIAMDNTTLVGALYAQSEATNLTYRFQTAVNSDLFNLTGGPVITITGTIEMEEEIYEVPYDPSHPDVLVIPDLTVLHGLVSNDNAVASQTTLDTQLFRINGQMERLFFYTIDKTVAATQTFVRTNVYDQAQLIYGSNQIPYTFNPLEHLQFRNTRDYRRPLHQILDPSGTRFPNGTYALDFVADNSARDQVLLEGVTNLRLRTQYITAPTGGSYIHFVQETLFA